MRSSIQRYDVLMTCGAFEPATRRGGPIKSAANIVDSVPESIALRVLCSDRDAGDTEPYPELTGKWIRRGRSEIYYLNTGSLRQWAVLIRKLREHRFDLLYVNSFWEPHFTLLPVLAARVGLLRVDSVLVAPRGEFSPGALSMKGMKKQLYLKSFGRVLRSMKVVWHASAELEAAEIKATVPWAEVLICQDQVKLPDTPLEPRRRTGSSARLVFISRINPKKNLDGILRALVDLDGDAQLDIYGPIEDRSYWRACMDLIGRLGKNVQVAYCGELPPDQVRDAFSNYDAFVFPTLGENFGHIIAESLSASCPVICGDTTPWTRVIRDGGGLLMDDVSDASLVKALNYLVGLDPGEREARRPLAAEAYRRWKSTVGDENVLQEFVEGHYAAPDRIAGI